MARSFLSTQKVVNLSSDPASGTAGEIYYNTTSNKLKYYNGTAWANVDTTGGGGSSVTISDTPPSSPTAGDQWYESDTGLLYIYYDSYWVQVGGSDGPKTNTFYSIDTPSGTNPTADSDVDVLTMTASNGMIVTGNASTDTIDFSTNATSLNTASTIVWRDSNQSFDITGIDFDTADTIAAAVGRINWDDGEGTLVLGLKGGNVNLNVGTNEALLCYNGTGSTIAKGSVVYTSGAQGQRPSIALAQANAESTSSKILGLAAESIANGAEGFVITFGIIQGVNTSSYTAGQALWLSETTAGSITTTKPLAPNHLVFVGYALSINASSGRIFVKPQNGYELDELHDVQIASKVDRDVIMYNSASNIWINEQINLGTDTVGDYVASVSGTDGVSITGTGEGAAVTIANSDKGSSQNIFKNITDGTNTAVADSNNDTFTLTAGTGIGIVVNATTDAATFTNSGVTSISFGSTGLTPATASAGAITVAGTLATTNGGTGLTSFTANGAVYATSTSALTTGTLPVTSGGTGVTTSTGTTNVVLSNTPTIVTPVIDSISISGSAIGATLWNTTLTTGSISMGGALTTGIVNIATGTAFTSGTGGQAVINIGTGAHTATTRTINIGGAGVGGTLAVNIGSATGTSTTTISGITQLTSGSAKIGNTTLVQGVTGNITFPSTAGTLIGSADTGTVTTAMLASSTSTTTGVTYAKMQYVSAQYRLLGRITAAAGVVEELTPDNIVTVLGQATVTTSRQGTGAVVLATSPTLTTPTIGVATATSINKVAITAPATSATLTIADGKTLTASNTLTFTGTDGSSVAFGTGGTVAYLASPAFTGNPTAPTPTAGDNDTSIATTEFVQTAVNSVTTNPQTASYTLALTDAGKVIEMNVGTANNLTVPPNGTIALPVGTTIDVVQYGAGQTTIVAGAGVTIRSSGSKLKLTSQYSAATLYKRGTDEWIAMGDLSA